MWNSPLVQGIVIQTTMGLVCGAALLALHVPLWVCLLCALVGGVIGPFVLGLLGLYAAALLAEMPFARWLIDRLERKHGIK